MNWDAPKSGEVSLCTSQKTGSIYFWLGVGAVILKQRLGGPTQRKSCLPLSANILRITTPDTQCLMILHSTLYAWTIHGGTSPLSCLPLWSHQAKSAALGKLFATAGDLNWTNIHFGNKDFYVEIHHFQVASSRFWGCVWAHRISNL